MKIEQYCQPQRCKYVELEQFLTCFRIARVCRPQLGFLVQFYRDFLKCIRPVIILIDRWKGRRLIGVQWFNYDVKFVLFSCSLPSGHRLSIMHPWCVLICALLRQMQISRIFRVQNLYHPSSKQVGPRDHCNMRLSQIITDYRLYDTIR